MASVAIATVSPACAAHSSSSALSSSSSVLRQASLQPSCLKAKMGTLREAIRIPCSPYGLASAVSSNACNRITTQAVAETLTEMPSVKAEEGVPDNKLPKLKLESDLLKTKAKRAELRRKRLVRKRHLRKKGRWPPSKMRKLKNV